MYDQFHSFLEAKAIAVTVLGGVGVIIAGASSVLPGGPWTEIGALGILAFCAWQLAAKIAPKWQADQQAMQERWMDHMVQNHRDQIEAMRESAIQYHEELKELTRTHREQAHALRDLVSEIRNRPCQFDKERQG